MNEEQILCACSAYEQKYYFNPRYQALPTAIQEELKIMHSLLKPKFFIPVHGEYRHLKRHVQLAADLGMGENNMLICGIGNCVELTRETMQFGESVSSGSRLVDGGSLEDRENSCPKTASSSSPPAFPSAAANF